jgi:hypothetical protein
MVRSDPFWGTPYLVDLCGLCSWQNEHRVQGILCVCAGSNKRVALALALSLVLVGAGLALVAALNGRRVLAYRRVGSIDDHKRPQHDTAGFHHSDHRRHCCIGAWPRWAVRVAG